MASWPTRPTFSGLPWRFMRASLVASRGMIWPMSWNNAAMTSSSEAPIHLTQQWGFIWAALCNVQTGYLCLMCSLQTMFKLADRFTDVISLAILFEGVYERIGYFWMRSDVHSAVLCLEMKLCEGGEERIVWTRRRVVAFIRKAEANGVGVTLPSSEFLKGHECFETLNNAILNSICIIKILKVNIQNLIVWSLGGSVCYINLSSALSLLLRALHQAQKSSNV